MKLIKLFNTKSKKKLEVLKRQKIMLWNKK